MHVTPKIHIGLVEQLNNKGVVFVSLKEAIDTTTATGMFMLTIFGAVVQLERDYLKDRQMEGIAVAVTEGKYKGLSYGISIIR